MPDLVIAIVGATASGKSELSLRVAAALDGEVVNADSMQLYRGLDIGTGKLASAERARIPHHLLDIWDVSESASVTEYQRLARAAIAGILARGRTPILVGGSGLYVRAAIDRLEFPGTDSRLRAALERELAEIGPRALHSRLARADPAAAEAILPSNGRRIVRALEVMELSGQRFSARLPEYSSVWPTVQIGLDVPRPELDQRIDRRVRQMWLAGLAAEVRGLASPENPGGGLRAGRTACRALGYAQVLRYLDGEWTQEEAQDQTVRATRRFARRQESWFRRDPRVRWLPASQAVPTATALAVVREFAAAAD